jgi:hypothetical protein
MRITGWLPGLLLFEAVFAAFSSFGQTPPSNDNYSNSITLTGTDVTFSGTLAGATVEDSQETAWFYIPSDTKESVWWNWTAPVTTTMTLQVLDSSSLALQTQAVDYLAIYTATNGSSMPDDLEIVSVPPAGMYETMPYPGLLLIDFRLSPQTISVPVMAGTNYQIQLVGSSSASYTIRLMATNAPIIVTPPRSQTVFSNSSALLYVLVAGPSPDSFTYQWQFNGNPLANQTAPMLALSNIDGTMAGNYSVVVSNSAGAVVSQAATLALHQPNSVVALKPLGIISNNFVFSLSGESGMNYRIQSTTDLVHWAPEVSFPIAPLLPNTTSVVFNSNSPIVLTVTNNLSGKYFRATPYVVNDPVAETCINNLREIRIARLVWERNDFEDSFMDEPIYTELIPYYPSQVAPFCPLDLSRRFQTSYAIRTMVQEPVCNIDGYAPLGGTHILEDPQ